VFRNVGKRARAREPQAGSRHGRRGPAWVSRRLSGRPLSGDGRR
jgi:hypothetical protein